MDDVVAAVEALDEALAAIVSDAASAVSGAGDADVVALLQVAARARRRVDAVIVETVGEIRDRSTAPARDDRLTSRFGCRNTRELLQRAMLCDVRAAARYEAVAAATHRQRSLASGAALPAGYPALRIALLGGVVDVDAVASAVTAFTHAGTRIDPGQRAAAERELAAAAWGLPVDDDGTPDPDREPAPAATAEDIRHLARALAAYLDQDGPPPADTSDPRRGLTLGTVRDGLIPVTGRLLPETAGQLTLLFDSILNPKNTTPAVRFTDPGAEVSVPMDRRTRPQRQHDALATICTVAARAGQLPAIGGAAPTLVVTVRAEDLITGRGHARINGTDEPVPVDTAHHITCGGTIERILFDDNGRIVGISTTDRVFNAHQRRAIYARDGGCVIPGCHVPATWCELHHVIEHSRGGPTHTDNGVALCWHHHRTLDHSGWQIRMNHGTPEIRGPLWWDPPQRWRPTRPRTRLVPV